MVCSTGFNYKKHITMELIIFLTFALVIKVCEYANKKGYR